MRTRRDFLFKTAAAGLAAAAVMKNPTVARAGGLRISAALRREETTVRLGGHGDNYHMSWAADDRQYVSVCDGAGWFEKPKGIYNSRLWTISGGPQDARFQDVQSYPELLHVQHTDEHNRYYGFGTLALEGRIYQFLSTPNVAITTTEGSVAPDVRFVGAKLIYSPDGGRSWCNQDGSTPVIWEKWPDRSRSNMMFFEEDQDAFALISLLQMGRDYRDNRDGYVYGYSPNGSREGTMNQLVMFRVPKARIHERQAYQFFAGWRGREAQWSNDMAARVPVLNFPPGWVNRTAHPWAWMPSVTYNAPLDVYLMASWGTAPAPNGDWFGKPSYLGMWTSATPWGPWTQIHEDTAWTPGNDPAARAFAPQIAPKWIAADGKSFWLVWSDFQQGDPAAKELYKKEAPNWVRNPDHLARMLALRPRFMPYYAFNAQRVDLVVV